MRLESLTYMSRRGWSGRLPEEMDSPKTLLLLFADAALLKDSLTCLYDIRTAFPQSVLIGCSTATPFLNGQIASGQAVLSICQFEKSYLKTTLLPVESPAASQDAGQTLGRMLYSPNQRLLLIFADDHILNVNEFMQGVNSAAPAPMLIGGGMAGHTDFIAGARLLVAGNQVQSHAVAAVGLYNDDDSLMVEQVEGVGMGTHSPLYEITGAKDRVLYELNHRPALEVYCEFLGELAPYLADITHSFPTGFFAQPDGPLRMVRSVFKIDEAARALIFFGDIPPERYIRFMLGRPSGFITSASATAASVTQSMQKRGGCQSLLALTISCICRQLGLGDAVKQESATAFAAMPAGTTQIGFYGSGEIARGGSGYCELHNHTITITLLGEQ